MECPVQGSNFNPDQFTFNKAMPSILFTVEYMFHKFKECWTSLDFKHKLCLR